MKCTECSAPVRPVVAVDIDGTLGNYHGHFIRFAAAYLGEPELESDYDGAIGFKHWATQAWGIDERTWHDIKLAYRQGAQKRSMPAYESAGALCRVLWDSGVELWLTTTRPYLRLDNIDPDTRFWLEQRGIRYHGLLYDELKYAKLAEYVDRDRVVAVVDDLPEMYEAAAHHFGPNVPILFQQRYNRAVKLPMWIGDHSKVQAIINERLGDWEESHDSSGHRSE